VKILALACSRDDADADHEVAKVLVGQALGLDPVWWSLPLRRMSVER
jgi:hypothetical protein